MSLDRHPADLLSPYLDGELEADERAAVEDHLGSCADCRAELTELQRLRTLLQHLPRYAPPRSFVIGPRPLARPPALSGTIGGFARALTSIAAAIIFVAMATYLATTGLPRQPVAAPSPVPAAAPARPALAPASQPRPALARAPAAAAPAAGAASTASSAGNAASSRQPSHAATAVSKPIDGLALGIELAILAVALVVAVFSARWWRAEHPS